MAYLRIHPLDPGMELMLAQIAHVCAAAAGGKAQLSDFLVNTVAPPKADKPEGGDFDDYLRARVKAKG
jgi:hypothetical protein